ncbi:ABC transporter permease [Marinilabilia rubra]|uniref:ABC transporter permease n=1 Tax=Marinilabilia rubra TaxID=2162893 RepID=A0A2U2BCQ4_9BACT|nr:ABC transporter permease [Marinilabilia rubra]PWE00856.1 ABC transporter permease [Marinilabilia rubra]
MKKILLTFRRLKKNKTASLLGISGLIVGLICVMFIFFWTVDEVSHDRFHEKIDRIFVVHAYLEGGQKEVTFDGCPPAVGPAIRDEYPEIETTSRYRPPYVDYLVQYKDKKYLEGVAFADYSLFDIFSFPFIKGSRGEEGVKNKVVLTQTTAQKYFGNEDPIGKMVKFNKEYNMRVVGVIEDIPQNSSVKFDALVPVNHVSAMFNREDYLTTWYNNSFMTYGLLNKPENFDKIASSVTNRIQQEMPESTNYLRAYKFKNGYLYEKGHIRNVRIFALIGLMVLLAATLNFINLNTARSVKQIKETGLRKTLGATRESLVRLIYSDIAIICLVAFMVAILVALAALPLFNVSIEKQINPLAIFSWKPLLAMTMIYLVTVFLAGSYPAFYLTSFSPVRTLRSSFKSVKSKGVFRNALVAVIFLVSLMLLSSTMIISRQTTYLQKMDLGFEKDQVMYVYLDGKLKENHNVFKEEVNRISNVESSTVLSYLPFSIGNNSEAWSWQGKDPDFKPLVTLWYADEDMPSTLEAKMVEGAYFQDSDQEGIVINEAFARIIGWDSFEGKTLEAFGSTYRIQGVIGDIHFNSLAKEVQPMVISPIGGQWTNNFMAIKLNIDNISSTLNQIKTIGQKLEPDIPMTYGFFDEKMASLLASERNLRTLVWIFSGFSIIVLVLGLLGVIMFMAEQKTKEIGVRKCMGEPVPSIVNRLIKPFLITGLVGFTIAIPVSWYLMNEWLQGFAYRIDMGIGVFVVAGLLIISLAVFTVIVQSWRAATRNPVEALRYE